MAPVGLGRSGIQVLIGMLAILELGAGPAWAQPPGDPGRGRAIAHQLCSACHLVSREHRGPVPDGIPSFMTIAARPDATEDRILGVLVSPPHPAMPTPPLSRQQLHDMTAYILSLR
jgi:mono/diheme cytochrome c family protein